jgi:hypothetical protein
MIFASFYLLSIILIEHGSFAINLAAQSTRELKLATKTSQHEPGATPESINTVWPRQVGGSSCDGNNEDSCTSSEQFFAQTTMPVTTQPSYPSTTDGTATAQGMADPGATLYGQSETDTQVTETIPDQTSPTNYNYATSASNPKSSSVSGAILPGAGAKVTANSFLGLLVVGAFILFWI